MSLSGKCYINPNMVKKSGKEFGQELSDLRPSTCKATGLPPVAGIYRIDWYIPIYLVPDSGLDSDPAIVCHPGLPGTERASQMWDSPWNLG